MTGRSEHDFRGRIQHRSWACFSVPASSVLPRPCRLQPAIDGRFIVTNAFPLVPILSAEEVRAGDSRPAFSQPRALDPRAFSAEAGARIHESRPP